MRKLLKDNEFGFPEGILLRGIESSRIEQLSDGVFALAITMLLISLEAPKNYDELIRFTQDLIVFVVCMVVIVRVWYGHYFFFLKYNLRDKQIIFINTFLLLVVLFFVYPLKFQASVLLRFYFYLLLAVILDQSYWKNIQEMTSGTFSWHDMPSIMIIYGCGYLLIWPAISVAKKSASRHYLIKESESHKVRKRYST